MKTLLLFLTLLLAQASQAFYDASIGRWISRDPIAEQSFRLAFEAESLGAGHSENDAPGLAEFTGKTLYSMIGNDAVTRTDYLGLLPTDKATRTIPDCGIEIYDGHGFLDNAFDDDGKLRNPKALDGLAYPHILKGTKCSAGTIIACNAAKFAVVDHGIPGVELDDKQIQVYQAINAIPGAVEKAKEHAKTICKTCSNCKEVTISVHCSGPIGKPGWFTSGSPLCGETFKVPCDCD